MNWSPAQYDQLERAIIDGSRIQVTRRGSRQVLFPERLRTDFGVEVLTARSMTTGDRVEVPLEEIDAFDVIG